MNREEMERFIQAAERMRLAEYVRFQSDRRRRAWDAFWQGVLRGLGATVGFALLGTLLLLALQRIAAENLPVIGDFLARVVEMVEKRMHGQAGKAK